MAATELQEEEEVGMGPDEEWLAVGPQAPKPDLDQCTRRCAIAHGAATSNPASAAKRVKKITTKATKAEAACHHPLVLLRTRPPPPSG